jgi:hypothetical protein
MARGGEFDESTDCISLHGLMEEAVAFFGLKIKVARRRLIRSSASPANADQASAVHVGPGG